MNTYTFRLTGAGILLLCLTILGVASCAQKTKKLPLEQEFAQFYTHFLQDSAFQMAHISFPLKGMPDNALAKGIDPDTFFWSAEDWKIHRPIDFETSGFKQELASFGDGMVIERIIHESGDYAMLRRFAKLADGWALIYYAGLNPLKKE